jgi:hypothetical protein
MIEETPTPPDFDYIIDDNVLTIYPVSERAKAFSQGGFIPNEDGSVSMNAYNSSINQNNLEHLATIFLMREKPKH